MLLLTDSAWHTHPGRFPGTPSICVVPVPGGVCMCVGLYSGKGRQESGGTQAVHAGTLQEASGVCEQQLHSLSIPACVCSHVTVWRFGVRGIQSVCACRSWRSLGVSDAHTTRVVAACPGVCAAWQRAFVPGQIFPGACCLYYTPCTNYIHPCTPSHGVGSLCVSDTRLIGIPVCTAGAWEQAPPHS